MIITSLSNNHIKDIIKLKEKKYRDIENKFLIEGLHLVEEANKYNLIEEIILLEGYNIDIKVPITYVTSSVMKKISNMDSIPKIMAIVRKKEEKELGNKIFILEDIQDPGNLGTIIRSANAFGIDTIVLSKKTVDLYNDKVIRSTQGMIFNTNIVVRDLEDFLNNIKVDYQIIGTKVDNGKDIKNINISNKFAIIIGNEGKGMSEPISSLCDEYAYIKMNDSCESLNAAVAASIIMYEVYNK